MENQSTQSRKRTGVEIRNMVDYSKWDRFASELESDDDDVEKDRGVQVHRIEDGAQVTVGPEGASASAAISNRIVESSKRNTAIRNQSSGPVNSVHTKLPVTTGKASEEYIAESHVWAQDRKIITLWIEVPASARGPECSVSLIEGSTLQVLHKGATVLSKALKYKINPPPDGEDFDWELVTKLDGKKYLQLQLAKYEYLPGSVFWWSAVFVDDIEIDVTQIAERKASAKGGEFAENWKQANEMFLAKIAEKNRHIDSDSDIIEKDTPPF